MRWRGRSPPRWGDALTPRLGPTLLQRVVFLRPALGALRIPDHVRVSRLQRALGGVPRHPAIALTIEKDRLRLVAAALAAQSIEKVALDLRRQRAIAGIGQPYAGNVKARLVAPKSTFSGRLAGRGACGRTSMKIAALSAQSRCASAVVTTRAPDNVAGVGAR